MRKYKVIDCVVSDFEIGWALWAWIEDVKTRKEFVFEIIESADVLDLVDMREPVEMEFSVMIDSKLVFHEEYTQDERNMVIRNVIIKFGDIIDEVSKECKKLKMMLSKFVPRYS